jgi:glucose/arabinose dehydrogenase
VKTATAAALVLVALSSVHGVDARAGGAGVAAGFEETVALTGLVHPTVVRFAGDGRIFVAEKSGLVKVFDGFADPSPTIFADLRANVHDFWDRGLLGLALAPQFPQDPYVYVLYTHDAPVGGKAPTWGSLGDEPDACPTPPGPLEDGCVVSGRLSRLRAAGSVMTGSEEVLVEGWCQQYPSHSVGSLVFGADGALYASAGDGASFGFADWGQRGDPPNPCGEPAAEGGALRSQDLWTSGDPTGLNGTVIRVDPATGEALPDNPLGLDPDPMARRVIGYGFRNPFRITARPGSSEIWVGEVGWTQVEEIDVIDSPLHKAPGNFGWPCYEGETRSAEYDAADLDACEALYETGTVEPPFFSYRHDEPVVAGEACPTGTSALAGVAFEQGSNFPTADDGALVVADYSRDCIWILRAGGDGRPDPATRRVLVAGAANPVDVVFGPDGALYYADFDGGTIRRVAVAREAPDTVPPIVSVTRPSDGSRVSGRVTLAADASDGGGVAGLRFRLDGVDLRGEDTTAPYRLEWNTATVCNGRHVLEAVARDRAGNVTTSGAVTVTVENRPRLDPRIRGAWRRFLLQLERFLCLLRTS